MSTQQLRSPSSSNPLFHLRWLILRHTFKSGQNNDAEAGFSLLECLVAIAVIGLTASLVLPPLFIAAASRVQNRRAEQALQIAQAEVSRIQTLVATGRHNPVDLPQAIVFPGNSANRVRPPASANAQYRKSVVPGLDCNTYTGQQIPFTTALPVDVDGEDTNGDGDRCEPDFFLQVFRDNGLRLPGTDTRPSSFRLGVRVYSEIAAWAEMNQNLVEVASLQVTSGTGNQRLRPLAVLYPTVSWSDRPGSLGCMRQAFSNGAENNNCPTAP